MEKIGLVKKISNGKAEIEVKRMSGCGENCKGCSGSCDTPNHTVILPNIVEAKVGDMVEIRGETKNVLKYTMILYLIPFSMLIIGIILGMSIFKSINILSYEPLSFLVGLVFMAVGYFIVRMIDTRLGKKDDIIKMTRII